MVNAEVPKVVLKPNPRNNPTMFKLFHNVQQTAVQHKKYVKEMKKLYKTIGKEAFNESFKNALYYVFTFGDANANVDRVIQFAATFSTSLDDEDEFLNFIFDIIFECQGALGHSVRYRASQLLAVTLDAMGEEAFLSDDICDRLLISQLQRLQDTRSVVRVRATLALNRLQNPMEPNDDVTKAYHFHMSCDPNSHVRRSVVMTIAKCSRNIPFVLTRLCDVDENVRRAAFMYIAAMSVTQLRVRQRIFTLKVGLNERNQRVRRVVEEILIPDWLCTYKRDIIDLLKAIRLDNAKDADDSHYVAKKLLETLFKLIPIDELLESLPIDKSLHLIPVENLNKEAALYWRHLTQHLHKIENDEALETVLPDLIVFIDYIKVILSSPCSSETVDPISYRTRQEVIHELACMLQVYDTSEVSGREALQKTIIYILTGDIGDLSEETIRALMLSLKKVVPDVNMRIQLVGSILTTLREPDVEQEVLPPIPDDTDIKLQKAKVRVSLNVAIEAQAEAVNAENYDLAAECKMRVAQLQKILDELNEKTKTSQPTSTLKEKKSDSATLNKCLMILNALLDTDDLKNITPTLKLILGELEEEIFQNTDLVINGLETIALFGMLDKNFARDNKAFFFSNLVNAENMACKALKCLIDLMCIHGVKVFEDHNESVESDKRSNQNSKTDLNSEDSDTLFNINNNVIELLLNLMDKDFPEYRLIIVGGLCRLMYLGHIESATILSKLILLWFNPLLVDEDIMRQIIGTFFQTFPYMEFGQEEIQKAAIPTLRALVNAPTSSPLDKIDQERVVKFLASLTKLSREALDSQGDMASRLCTHLMRHPANSETTLICRMLALLQPPKNTQLAANLTSKLRELLPKLPDKLSCRNMTRYVGHLEAMERSRLGNTVTGLTRNSRLKTNDTTNLMSATSLPQPMARSTHVIINETVEEVPEIDETSPRATNIGPVSEISEENTNQIEDVNTITKNMQRESRSSDSDNNIITPPKKLKTKDNKKKLSAEMDSKQRKHQRGVKRSRSPCVPSDLEIEADKGTHDELEVRQSLPQSGTSDSSNSKENNKYQRKRSPNTAKAKKKTQKKTLQPEAPTRRAPRKPSRSSQNEMTTPQAEKTKKKTKQPEAATRRSPCNPSGSSKRGSRSPIKQKKNTPSQDRSSLSSAETTLHTIIYDADMEQELLEDSSFSIDSGTRRKAKISIPETPDGSEESDAEVEVIRKGKENRSRK